MRGTRAVTAAETKGVIELPVNVHSPYWSHAGCTRAESCQSRAQVGCVSQMGADRMLRGGPASAQLLGLVVSLAALVSEPLL